MWVGDGPSYVLEICYNVEEEIHLYSVSVWRTACSGQTTQHILDRCPVMTDKKDP